VVDCGRSPDDAKIKKKMVYAASRDALRRSLEGVALEIQATDYEEVAYEAGERTHLLSVYLLLS
jgi:cofilin